MVLSVNECDPLRDDAIAHGAAIVAVMVGHDEIERLIGWAPGYEALGRRNSQATGTTVSGLKRQATPA